MLRDSAQALCASGTSRAIRSSIRVILWLPSIAGAWRLMSPRVPGALTLLVGERQTNGLGPARPQWALTRSESVRPMSQLPNSSSLAPASQPQPYARDAMFSASPRLTAAPGVWSSGWPWLLRVLIAYLVVPNAITGLIVYFVTGDWHPINLDYLLIGAVCSPFSLAFPTFAFAGLVLLDMGLALAPIFHFDGATFSQGLLQLFAARPSLTIAIAGPVIAAAILLGFTLRRLTKPHRQPSYAIRSLVLAAGALLAGLDALNGSNQLIHADGTRLSLNLAGSGLYHITVEMRDAHREAAQRKMMGAALPSTRGASSQLLDDISSSAFDTSKVQNVALVLVESMGLPRDERAAALLLAPLTQKDVSARYVVRTGTVPFSGPTTAGEFRELCGVVGTYLIAPEKPLNRCIPELLRKRGFQTIALHGFRSSFFNRASWYPVIGFEHGLFDADAAAPDSPRCGAIFRGPCDEAVGREFAEELLSGTHRFVYWLTLSSHFPIDHRAADENAFDCRELPDGLRDQTVCDLMRTWSTVLQSVRTVALDPRLQSTRFIVVGDHSPPFLDQNRRQLFSETSVPFVELTPRTSRAQH